MIRTIVRTGVLLFALPAGAVVTCPPSESFLAQTKRIAMRALKVSLVGEDDRKTAAQYGAAHGLSAREVEQRYAATGNLVCQSKDGKEHFGQAQVTVKNDIITTAGHVMMGRGDCAKTDALSSCRFVVRVDGRDVGYEIAAVAATGYVCPAKGPRTIDQDWMVLRLKKPVDARIKPYAIRADYSLALHQNEGVVQIGRSGDWPAGHVGNMSERARHYGDCKTGSADQFGTSGLVETDCDSDSGSSGGSVVTPGPDPVLVAINHGSIEHGSPGCDPKIGATGHDDYHPNCWAGLAAPIAKDLQAAVLKAAGTALPGVGSRPPEGFKLPSIKMK